MSDIRTNGCDDGSKNPQENVIRPDVVEAIQTAYFRTKSANMAQRLWLRVLTEEDREKLGDDLPSSYDRLGTVGMWMQARGVGRNEAIIDVASELGFMDGPTSRWLCRELQLEDVERTASPDRPVWDKGSGRLLFQDCCVRKVRVMKKPSNIQRILDAFQQAGWPHSIPNPLGNDQHQLHLTLQSLKKRLSDISFHGHEGGRVIYWQAT